MVRHRSSPELADEDDAVTVSICTRIVVGVLTDEDLSDFDRQQWWIADDDSAAVEREKEFSGGQRVFLSFYLFNLA